MKKAKIFYLLCTAIIGFFSLFFIPKMDFLAWRSVSIIEFKTFRLISSLLRKSGSESFESKNLLASHRGAFSKSVAENSEKSIILAARRGFRYIEIDITFTKDLIPIIFHDLNLKHKTSDPRKTSEVSWDEIKTLKLHDGQSILSLNQFLSDYAQLFDAIILDIKSENNFIKERAASFVKVVSESKFTKDIYVIGLNCEFLSIIKNSDLNLKIGCEDQGILYNYFKGNHLISLNYSTQYSTLEYSLASRFDMALILWTINNREDIKNLYYLKNSIILTDLHNVN